MPWGSLGAARQGAAGRRGGDAPHTRKRPRPGGAKGFTGVGGGQVTARGTTPAGILPLWGRHTPATRCLHHRGQTPRLLEPKWQRRGNSLTYNSHSGLGGWGPCEPGKRKKLEQLIPVWSRIFNSPPHTPLGATKEEPSLRCREKNRRPSSPAAAVTTLRSLPT